MTLFVTAILISLVLSTLCSIMEACLLSLSLTDIAKISEKHPRVADIYRRFKENIQKPIAVILIVNTFAHTIGAAVSGSQFSDLFGPRWIGLYSVVFSLIMIQWTEILPKTLAVRHNRLVAIISAVPFDIVMKVFAPVVFVIQLINKPFEGKRGAHGEADALKDISVLARFATINNMISKEQEDIVARSILLSRKSVSDIMMKRDEMKVLSAEMTLADAMLAAHAQHHTRFPLTIGDASTDIVGYVNFKDILNALRLNPEDPTLKGICRPIMNVDPAEKATNLLNRLIKGSQHIAVVRDSSGLVAGMVTLEDVIEEIVGNINDEYDILPDYCYAIGENRYMAGGGTRVSYLRQKIDPDLPSMDVTLNEWLLEKLGSGVKAEDRYTVGRVTFEVRKTGRTKVREVLIVRQ